MEIWVKILSKSAIMEISIENLLFLRSKNAVTVSIGTNSLEYEKLTANIHRFDLTEPSLLYCLASARKV